MTNETNATKSPSFDPGAMMQDFMSKFADMTGAKHNPAAGWLEMNEHWTNFLGERFKKDSALLHQLGKCASPADAGAAQMAFYKEAAEDYQREFKEMAELGKKAIGQISDKAVTAKA